MNIFLWFNSKSVRCIEDEEETTGELVKRNQDISPHPAPLDICCFPTKKELFHQGSCASASESYHCSARPNAKILFGSLKVNYLQQ